VHKISQTTNNAVFDGSIDSANTKNTTIMQNMTTTQATPVIHTIPKIITIPMQNPLPLTST